MRDHPDRDARRRERAYPEPVRLVRHVVRAIRVEPVAAVLLRDPYPGGGGGGDVNISYTSRAAIGALNCPPFLFFTNCTRPAGPSSPPPLGGRERRDETIRKTKERGSVARE